MAAYVVFCIRSIDDEEAMADYRQKAVPMMKAQGLKFFAGPSATEELEGGPLKAVVVIEFDDTRSAKDWYYSDEYQEVAAIRIRATDSLAFIVESWPTPAAH